MDTLEMKEVEAAIEGILFASGEPVAVDRICMAMDMDRPTVELVLQKLTDYYAYERRGMRLLKMEDSYQLCSAPEYGDIIRRAFEVRKPAKLSQPALEVLTIIAYYQPTTRAYVDQIRGVDSSYTVGLLLDRHLIEECGRLQVPGRPGCTAPPRLSCGPSICGRWMICRRCPAWRATASCGWTSGETCWSCRRSCLRRTDISRERRRVTW